MIQVVRTILQMLNLYTNSFSLLLAMFLFFKAPCKDNRLKLIYLVIMFVVISSHTPASLKIVKPQMTHTGLLRNSPSTLYPSVVCLVGYATSVRLI